MPHRDSIIFRQIDAILMSQEVIDLLLIPHLRGEILSGDLNLFVRC